ncbi:MAG: SMODS domain-containing nucleotidyltransferase [Thermoanaerobaculia bacterium]
MNLPSYFTEFLSEIEPSPSYKDDQQTGHTTLRKRLAGDDDFGLIHVNTFLQGSYKRYTAVHPGKDVDIVVVTSLDPDAIAASAATARLKKVLEKYYPGKVTPQNRSLNVELSYVTMDVVIAASRQLRTENAFAAIRSVKALEDAGSWKAQPLQIPDHDLQKWVDTHPKRQLEWTTELNKVSEGYFVPLVKLFKWWRKQAYTTPAYPKGYVLERIAGEVFDRTKRDHAEGFVQLLRNIVSNYEWYALVNSVPTLTDPGVPSHNVLARVSAADFKTFINHVKSAVAKAELALSATDKGTSAKLWRELFGSKFPAAPTAKAAFPAAAVRPPNRPEGFG